ncbi:MAG: alcohol dehydrogenase catalytic domain-containing protein [Deltaproteobacteria bacterium]|nr:alcohol dehydrogenase catalytic domain-containing protein [Deltaproteobacteria bacterium]MBI3387281.1 alcohol dehydrogenase catalytic domain-containing protein [Deltaproteobacteria bacterium]
MRAAFCVAPGQFELRDVPEPAPAPGEVLIKIHNCGICGSDLHWYHGGGIPIPSVCPGHEISGEVAALGNGVRGVRAGDRVAIEPLLVCHECRYCRSGEYQLCRRMRIRGISADGGFADYVSMPESAVFPLPQSVDWELGAMAEPMAVCVHALRLAALPVGARVLVLGAGTIGLLAIVAARAAGAAEVLISARYPHQHAAAERLGARVFDASSEGAARLIDYGYHNPVDAVIETVGGVADTLNDAVQLVRAGGVVVVLGVFTGPVTCNGLLLVSKEVRIVGSLTYSRAGVRAEFEIALQLLAEQRTSLRPLVTHTFSLDRVGEGFAAASDKTSGAIKVTVTS